MGQIDREDSDRNPTDRSPADQSGADPPEMATPGVSARMEEPCFPACLRVDAREIRSLVMITGKTGHCQIPSRRWAAVLLRYDVVELEAERGISLRDATVLAAASCPLPDQALQVSIHPAQAAGFDFFMVCRALECKMSSRQPRCS